MTSIQLTLTGAQATAEVDGLLTAGMVGVPVSITWDESWNGLVKALVCRSDGCVRTCLNVGHQATVAPEVFRTERWTPNSLYLGVEGRDAEGRLVIPSTFAYCGQILPGAVTEGAISEEPESPAWAQILGLIGDMGSLAASQKETLVGAINEAIGQSDQEITLSAAYQLSASCRVIPTGAWSTAIPTPAAGRYLWTKITLSREGGATTSVYCVSGGVTSVNGAQPNDGGNVTLTAAQVGAVPLTGGTMTGPLNVLTPTEDGNAASKGYVDRAFPVNLLDNSDFRDPVNQRGKTSYTGSGYTIDRWENDMGLLTVSVADGSVRLQRTGSTDNFKQTVGDIHSLLGKAVTFALRADGNVNVILGYIVDGHTSYFGSTESDGVFVGSCTVPENAASVKLYIQPQDANACTLYWVALYEGEYTADTLPVYKPKGYGAELAECQRYYQVRSTSSVAAADMRPTMRLSSPTVTAISGGYSYSADL